MLGGALHPSLSTRCALLFAVAVALVLPAPARCASCANGTDNCAQCEATANAASASSVRPCCQNHAAPEHAAPVATSCQQVHVGKCNCNLRPVDRTAVSVERLSVTPEIVATLPAVQPVLAISANASGLVVFAIADLPPPLPHRVLHCAWII